MVPKYVTLTISAKATNKNIPAVTANIQSVRLSVVPRSTPIIRPAYMGLSEKAWKHSPLFIVRPLDTKIAKSPGDDKI